MRSQQQQQQHAYPGDYASSGYGGVDAGLSHRMGGMSLYDQYNQHHPQGGYQNASAASYGHPYYTSHHQDPYGYDYGGNYHG